MPPTIDQVLDAAVVMPIMTIEQADVAAGLAEALAAGGLKVAEVTLRTPAALAALSAMKTARPDLIIGMGTIRTESDAKRALDAGADFLVTPGTTPRLVEALIKLGAPALPGAATASEAATLADAGFRAQKFFPAEPAGGLKYLAALKEPLPDIVFCPTGGIGREAVADYLALANVACVGGSWVAPAAAISAQDWSTIEANARAAAACGAPS